MAALTDWNDLHVAAGLGEVRRQFVAAVKAARPEPVAEANPPPAVALAQGEGAGIAADVVRDNEWQMGLQRKNGSLLPNQHNIALILENSPEWQGVLAYNEFRHVICKRNAPPFRGGAPGDWSDVDATKLAMWLQQRWEMNLKQVKTADEAARAVAWDNRWHPVREWLEGLPKWDGEKRLEHLFPGVFGTVSNEYTQFLGKALLVGLVARVFDPGCKVDEMIVMESGQGVGKSTALRELVGSEFYLETSGTPGAKDFLIDLQGAWLVEIGEMQSFSKAERNLVKQIITRRDDKFRAPYDKYSTAHPRQNIFTGTTNDDSYLSDPTGARRFLPITITRANIQAIKDYRQLWFAEALALYRSHFRYWDYPKEIAMLEQDQRYQEDSWEVPLWEYVQGEMAADDYPLGKPTSPLEKVTVRELMSFALKLGEREQTKQEQMRVAGILHRWGWKKGQLQRDSGARTRPFFRPKPGTSPPVSPPPDEKT